VRERRIMYKCIIVDDEPHAIEGLKKYIDHIPELEIVKTFTDPVKALREIPAGDDVDLILLDVDMPGITGIELAKELRQKTDKLIFTTAHSKYGYEAFEVDADAFLLKPYQLSKFISTINKLFPKDENELEGLTDKDDFIFIKTKDETHKLIKVYFRDIIAVESKMNYVQVHTASRSILTYMTLSEISKKLLAFAGFMQFQRSFVISQDHIDYIEGNSIVMHNGIKISVGDYYRKYFNEFVDSKLLKARRRNA